FRLREFRCGSDTGRDDNREPGVCQRQDAAGGFALSPAKPPAVGGLFAAQERVAADGLLQTDEPVAVGVEEAELLLAAQELAAGRRASVSRCVLGISSRLKEPSPLRSSWSTSLGALRISRRLRKPSRLVSRRSNRPRPSSATRSDTQDAAARVCSSCTSSR